MREAAPGRRQSSSVLTKSIVTGVPVPSACPPSSHHPERRGGGGERHVAKPLLLHGRRGPKSWCSLLRHEVPPAPKELGGSGGGPSKATVSTGDQDVPKTSCERADKEMSLKHWGDEQTPAPRSSTHRWPLHGGQGTAPVGGPNWGGGAGAGFLPR